MFKMLVIRFAIPLVLLIGAGAIVAVPLTQQFLTQWFRADVEMRAKLVMSSIETGLVPLLKQPNNQRVRDYLARVTADQRLLAVVVCGPAGAALYRTERTPAEVVCPNTPSLLPENSIVTASQGLLHVATFPFEQTVADANAVVIVHDLSFIDRRQSRARDLLLAFAGLSAALTLVLCVTIAWLILRRWARVLVEDIRGKHFLSEAPSRSNDAVLTQVRHALRDIEAAQRMEIEFRENWTPEALRHVVKDHLDSAQLIVVANREPYIHSRENDKIVVKYPASGMVTALEPVMRACSGVWVAHGSGDADRDTVDKYDRVAVPPDDPAYSLRRVWLTPEEEEGFYFGFSNEGLWPLCHQAYVRPAFRPADWAQYLRVNNRFADAIASEARDATPIVLMQDYHFALAPGLLRTRVPGALIALFWHIPWPNPETFGICPWRHEIVSGMLQSDIIGFHTQQHCQNFLATVDQVVECHIDQERSTVTIQDHVCHVAPYPISIEWPPHWLTRQASVADCRTNVLARYGLTRDIFLGVGVERWDFTKGIVDRMLALERLLEREPQWLGKLVFLQVAAPTRSRLAAYQELQRSTLFEAERINARFGGERYKPIILISEHQDPDAVYELYRACNFCLVNSLHDGMNLVAKEFVAAREDDQGVLILSTFAGASRELVEALIVNPFDIEETALAIARALRMPQDEQRERMRLMRRTVKENNVFRWAGRMLMDASRIRQRQRLRALTGEPAWSGGAEPRFKG